MTLQKHPMDSWRPNEFLEDIMSEQELEQHQKELRALQARNTRHDMAVSKSKYSKFDRFQELITKHEEVNFQLLKAYDLNVNDAVSIAYSIIGHFAFGGIDNNLYGYLVHELPENSDESLLDSMKKVSKKPCYAHLEEAAIIAFSKFRGGKLNRRASKLAEFFKNVEKSERLDIRAFYASNKGSSDSVRMIHQLICAYKFDNVDNQKQNRPLMFDYDNRSKKFSNFFQFLMTAYVGISESNQEFIDYLIVNRFYHYSEICLIEQFVETFYEDVFNRPRILD